MDVSFSRLASPRKGGALTRGRGSPEAAVPICKFKVMIDGHMIEADLNTNERLGACRSALAVPTIH